MGEELKQENREIKDRNLKMEAQMSAVAKERAAVAQELEQVKLNFRNHLVQQQGEGAGLEQYQQALMQTQQALAEKQAECETMKRDLGQRLGDSAQFRELKSIVKKKNEEVKMLKQQMMAAGLAPPPGVDEGIDLAADSD